MSVPLLSTQGRAEEQLRGPPVVLASGRGELNCLCLCRERGIGNARATTKSLDLGIECFPHPASALGRPSVWPLFLAPVPTVHGGTHSGMWDSSCGEEWGAVVAGWALCEVGGLIAAGGWVLWGEMSVQRLRKEWVKLGDCVGLVPAAQGGV